MQLQSGAAVREKKVLVTTTTHIFRPQDEFLAMNEKTVTGNLGSRTLGGDWSN